MEKKGNFTNIKKDKYKKPGNIVAIDQLISTQLGLIPQSSGYLTFLRI